MIEVTANADATQIDVHDLIDETTGIRYIGKATKTFEGRWLCLAQVGNALCRVEVTVKPTVNIDIDPGDEDDRAAKRARLERDLGRSLS